MISQTRSLSHTARTLLVLGALALVSAVVLPLAMPSHASGDLVTEDLTEDLDVQDLADALVGEGIAVTGAEYTGADEAAGGFSGGTGIIGFDEGVILSTGNIADVQGPNDSSLTSTILGTPGDSDLDDLSGFETFDAAILELDFIPQESFLTFDYVFASEEYNEYVGSQYNDVFAFFVNDQNCAVIATDTASATLQPISINTINNGESVFDTPPSNPDLYINNDPFDPDITGDTIPDQDLLNTQMDGLTEVLTCEAEVNPGVTNTIKLAIADASDSSWDAAVFIRAGSLTAGTPAPVALQGDVDCDGDVDAVDALKVLQHIAGVPYVQNEPCPDIGTGDPIWGDVDCDGDVDAVDALKILQFIAAVPFQQMEPCVNIGQPL